MKKIAIGLATILLVTACQTTEQKKHSLSLSEVEQSPALVDLPMLVVKTITPKQDQRMVVLQNDFNEIFQMNISNSSALNDVPLKVGEKVKVIGDYTEETTADEQIVIHITPEKITLVR